jgi:hypothetical protein
MAKTYSVPSIGQRKLITISELWEVLQATDGQLRSLAEDPAQDQLVKLTCSAIIQARKTGNWQTVDSILNRVIGKPKEALELSGPTPVIIKRRNGEEIELSAKGEPRE